MARTLIGVGLKACRERMGFTQQELAEQLLKDVTYISRVENGKAVPDAETYNAWIKITGGQMLMHMYVFGDAGVSITQAAY